MAKTYVGLLAHHASVDKELVHRKNLLADQGFVLKALFGPQHGFAGYTQANMIEVGSDTSSSLPIYSLYGDLRKPSAEMLKGLDALVIDLQDVGVRGYTYIWTMLNVIEACAEHSVKVIVSDRPNPIGGMVLEGPLLQPYYYSFVGMHSIPIRHGMTMAELAKLLVVERKLDVELEIETCVWRRAYYFDETNLPWVMPSPNIPTLDTAIVYPGMELFEGVNISEGRGTTRPFELFGAPFIDGEKLAKTLNKLQLPGIHFRPAAFQPTFDKWQGELCQGCQLHVVDRHAFRSVATAIHILASLLDMYPSQLTFNPPPYEYEEKLMPFDILSGSDETRQRLKNGDKAADIVASWQDDLEAFDKRRQAHLLYS